MNALTKFREAKGLTQEQVAAMLGTTKATVSRWESEKRPVAAKTAVEIERSLGIPRHELRPDIFSENETASPQPVRKSIIGLMKGMVTLPDDFNPDEPFWELHKEWEDFEIGGLEDHK